jgi:hypothetical protein
VALIAGVAYWAAFTWLHPFLFDRLYDRWTADLVTEHQAAVVRATLYGVFAAVLMLISLASDFTKVRVVVEDRRSAIAAFSAAMRFLRRRPIRVLALYGLNILAALVLARLWLQIAPLAARPDWIVLLAGQVYLVARIWARLGFIASELVFFQGDLAHAQFTAAPDPVWPDSPAVEAIQRHQRSLK